MGKMIKNGQKWAKASHKWAKMGKHGLSDVEYFKDTVHYHNIREIMLTHEPTELFDFHRSANRVISSHLSRILIVFRAPFSSNLALKTPKIYRNRSVEHYPARPFHVSYILCQEIRDKALGHPSDVTQRLQSRSRLHHALTVSGII